MMKLPQNLVDEAKLREVEVLKLRVAQALSNTAVIFAVIAYFYPVFHLNYVRETSVGSFSLYDVMFRISLDVVITFPLIAVILFIYPVMFILISLFNISLTKKYLRALAVVVGFFTAVVFLLFYFYEISIYNTLFNALDVGITGIEPSDILSTRLGEACWLLLTSFLLLLLALQVYSEEVRVKVQTYYDVLQNEAIMRTVLANDKAYI